MLVAFLATSLTSCLTYEEVEFVGVKNVDVESFSMKEAVIKVTVQVKNPNKYKIKITNSDLDLYPEPLRAEIDSINAVIYENVNNGVYRCGFARSQAAYETAYESLFATIEELFGLKMDWGKLERIGRI